MDAFRTHEDVITNYRSYLSSFLSIKDLKVKGEVEASLKRSGFMPEPLIQFNPEFAQAEPLQNLVEKGEIHEDLPSIFGDYRLYQHQFQAIKIGLQNQGFVVTSGTGSGKSLTYLATIFNDLLKKDGGNHKGVKAILVYPMNALINSQEEEIKKYHINYLLSKKDPDIAYSVEGKNFDLQIEELEKLTGVRFPITYTKYTGQEGSEAREAAEKNQSNIILTNYMMLELIMTRQSEKWMRESIAENLKFLVFDELHTYRGRQGSDVSLLIRRIKGLANQKLICIGTSATMSSEGTPLEKKSAVAEVAETIFGEKYEVEAIIGEYLKYCTQGRECSEVELAEAIEKGIEKVTDNDLFITHPLTNWLEREIALKDNDGLLERGKPLRITDIAEALSKASSKPVEKCKMVLTELLKWTEYLNNENRKKNNRITLLPFRFHQFISQTSHVSVTLDKREDRKITIESGRYLKTEKGDEIVFPVLFSRISGYDFLCVRKDVENQKLEPRNPDESIKNITLKDAKSKTLGEEDFENGYIVLDENEEFWNENPASAVPEAWLNGKGDGLKEFYAWQMPTKITFDREGNYSHDPIYPLKGYFISAKLRIDPTAGVVYEDVKTKENTKLMKIGNEGRSTATTVMAFSVVDSMAQQGVNITDQKLLSFTDNRQDASLQAGHFNDFLATVKLRSALYYTLLKNPEGLEVHNIHERLFQILQLPESRYAVKSSEDPDFPEEPNMRALKKYLLFRIFQDLKRGWRYTLPNLEQTALIKIGYNRLPELAAMQEKFEEFELLQKMDVEKRETFLLHVLDYFRTNFSIDHPILLDDRFETENFLKLKLDEKKLWSLDHEERIDAPTYLRVDNPGKTRRGIYNGSIGSRSSLGKYIKRKYQDEGLQIPNTDGLKEFITNLCVLLRKTGFLSETYLKGTKTGEEGIPAYLLRSDAIRWQLGDEENVPVDETRINRFLDFEIKPNLFFQNLYKKDFTKYYKEFEGREHTGQLDSESRIDREDRFRKGSISALFCSPTMELGIDIANLNVVHMRNVPPNPANYAQRSGRAGRSGQTALVFTYCSSYSSHDQNYFKEASTMVSGAVVPPRIDLINQELIRTHVHAYLLMKLELGDLHTSVDGLLNMDKTKELPVKQSVRDLIQSNLDLYGDAWIAQFKNDIVELLPEIRKSWWFESRWFENIKVNFIVKFEESFNRWRTLYHSAKKMIENANIIVNDPIVKHSSPEFNEAERQRSVGLKQIALLKDDYKKGFSGQSEFYVFRYLASEGFIPGYNFTRLPVRTFVGFKHNDRGAYISRPRFVGLREFGPNNVIYHDGNKFAIERMMMTDADALLRTMKISKTTGYVFMDDAAKMANNDPITDTELSGDNAEIRSKVLELSESEAKPRERISCEEEDRMSTGFEIEQYFNYAAGMESTKNVVIKSGHEPVLNVIFGPATQMISLNRKWRRSQDEGFYIDKRNGKWLRKRDLEIPDISDNARQVLIFTQDTADSIYIQPLENLKIDKDQLINLSYALKLGLESLFQVEEREIGVSIMGNNDVPNILIYEAAEGSLGLLSQLISQPLKMKQLFEAAYSCLHYNPKTREETEEGKNLPKASYLDLLSYYNQRHHEILDRSSIRSTLEYLMDCKIDNVQNGNDREEQYKSLLDGYDKNSSTEFKLLKYLYDNCLALPDKAQVNVPEFYISVDFVYNNSGNDVLVFCDGSVHDETRLMETDTHKRDLLRSKGYDVIVWHYLEPLDELVKRRKDIFRKVC